MELLAIIRENLFYAISFVHPTIAEPILANNDLVFLPIILIIVMVERLLFALNLLSLRSGRHIQIYTSILGKFDVYPIAIAAVQGNFSILFQFDVSLHILHLRDKLVGIVLVLAKVVR